MINYFIYLLSSGARFDFRFIARARACLITVAWSDTVSSLTERISKVKRRSVYRPRAVGMDSARESVCSRSVAWRLRAAFRFLALLGEPSKNPQCQAKWGQEWPWREEEVELERNSEGLKGGELYTRGLSHRRHFSSSSSSTSSSFFLFVFLSFSLCSALPQQCSLSLFNQPPVVFHLAGAPLEPTNIIEYLAANQERSRQCCGKNKKDPPLLAACQNKTAL